MIWIEHNQICMQQLKISFFRRQILEKSTFILNKFSKGGTSPPPTPHLRGLQNNLPHSKSASCVSGKQRHYFFKVLQSSFNKEFKK